MIRQIAVVLCIALPVVALAGARVSLDDATPEQLASLANVDSEFAEAVARLRTDRGGHIGSIEALRVLPGATDAALTSIRAGTDVRLEVPLDAGKSFDSPEAVLAEFGSEPTVQRVQDWTNEYAQTAPASVRRMLGASKSFAALPRLKAQYRIKDGWDQDFTNQGAFGSDPEWQLDDAQTDQDRYVTVEATWELGELVMSSERLRAVNEAQDIVKLRDKMLTKVTQLYFDRRRHQVDVLLSPASNVRDRVEDQVRLMELTAGLDALTGGRFSEALSQSGG
jgi:hypothetical protein